MLFEHNDNIHKENGKKYFDIIWCNHVLYDISIKHFPLVLSKFNQWLLPKDGYILLR